MDPRSQFLLQLLQKLGAPLMAAVSAHSVDEEKDAQTLAALLSESVKVSISLSQVMNLKTDDGDADAIRVSLATLAAGLIAQSYKQQGRMPGEAETRRISKALESVIVFADNFAPAAEHAQRLKTLDETPPFFDPVQTNIYAIHALLPAIAAIEEFAFGQTDTKLIQDIWERLGSKAKELLNGMSGESAAMGELVIMQALGNIYAGAHRRETERLKAAGDAGSGGMDAVWKSFETQISMLSVLLSSMTGVAVASGSGGGAVKPAITSVEPTPPPSAPSPPLAAPVSAPPAGGSPMSFFKKK